jgi:hypothetical protein
MGLDVERRYFRELSEQVSANSWWLYSKERADRAEPLQAVIHLLPSWQQAKAEGNVTIGQFLRVFPDGGNTLYPNPYLNAEFEELRQVLGRLWITDFIVFRDDGRLRLFGLPQESSPQETTIC